jgi:phosphoglycolate phosphatase
VSQYQYLLFDLDGTLTDPKIGIINSIQYALGKMGLPPANPKKLELFLGPPIQDSFHNIFGFDDQKTWQAISYYREYFEKKGIFENKTMQGIVDLLQKLSQEKKNMYVVTSKPTYYAEQIIKYFHLDTHFIKIIGANLDGTKSHKEELILEVLKLHQKENKQYFVMIGDRKYDIYAAQRMHIDSIGVVFGYGSQEEIKKAKPTFIVNSIDSLKKLLLK